MRVVAVTAAPRQNGMALISSLLLLVVVTILAVSMFRGFGVEEKIAGNVREKERALHAAEDAQQYAEWWLSNANNAANPAVPCNNLLNAELNQGQICVSLMNGGDYTTTPWPDLGVKHTPVNMVLTSASPGTASTYYGSPQFYIADIGASLDGQGEVYQVDAIGYGANSNSVAVVESTFEVSTGVNCLTCQ